ncbi:MAG: hypothetical protein HQ507_01300 [Candidatus Marinimicrobia bacterium]|nr:hypothetical protein [Candidatus Neomarinimicrobiota bacterium]
MSISDIELKRAQFNQAIELYNSRTSYASFSKTVATVNVTLQIVLLYLLLAVDLTVIGMLTAFFMAYILTDFINGLIHMIMDHQASYTAIYGPLEANFHLHHHTPMYTKRALPLVYFHETGAKIWLAVYLLMTLVLLTFSLASPLVLHLLVYIGVLSSIAEVSHYLCHTSESSAMKFLAGCGILLSRQHHTPHHEQDNRNYAFLNGMSDPLLNWIARKFYSGYKNTTDQHFADYKRAVKNHR